MNFTDREIELAKQLHASGFEWKPQGGDYVLYHEEINMAAYFQLDIQRFVLLTGNYDLVSPNDCIWLPLWHQCRERLQYCRWKHLQLTHNVGCNNGKISVSAERGSKILRVSGDTDLEAMYQIMLEALP